ncbi:hypothetical protein acdb102_22540 [Acidothermaceae bacterium B102]|nr:hypothetical protein acdb102_22540 [Acidothermaceae bacterium B102]
MHLPSKPTFEGVAGRLLTHELTHLRQPLARPRFWLESSSGALDHDERSVQTLTSDQVRHGPAPSGTGPGRLPVMRSAIAGSTDDATAADHSPAATAGIVDSLPTMAGSAAAAGRSAALQVVSRAMSAPGMTSLHDGQDATASSATTGGATGEPADDGGQAGPAGADPAAGSAGASSDQTAAPQGSPSIATAAETALPEQVVDSLVEALELRLLADLDRRGGRYSGAF